VAGALALLAQAFPNATPAQLEDALKDSARDRGITGPDSDYGHGVVDVRAAYQWLVANPPAPPVNEAPLASDDSYAVVAGATFHAAAPGVLGNDRDPNGDALTVTRVSGVSGGLLALQSDGSFTYTPDAGTTNDSFTYEVSDGLLRSNVATVSISVAANAPPSAADDAYSVAAGSALQVAAPGVLANDSDPEGNTLSAVLASAPTGGALTLNGDGSFRYMPASGTTHDAFTYEVHDGVQAGNLATVTINVTAAANQAPVAANDLVTTRKNVPLSIKVLANDTDSDGALDPATVTIVTAPNRGGTAVVGSDGSVAYTPRRDYVGIETFGYTVQDTQGKVSNKATVAVRILR